MFASKDEGAHTVKKPYMEKSFPISPKVRKGKPGNARIQTKKIACQEQHGIKPSKRPSPKEEVPTEKLSKNVIYFFVGTVGGGTPTIPRA